MIQSTDLKHIKYNTTTNTKSTLTSVFMQFVKIILINDYQQININCTFRHH